MNEWIRLIIIFRMKTLLALAILLAIAAGTMVPHVGPVDTHIPRTYKMQLNDPPLKRWAQIAKDYAHDIKRFEEYIELLPIPEGFYEGVEWFARNEFKYQDFVAQIDAQSQLMQIPFDKMFFYNFFYEFSTIPLCTGFLVRNKEGVVMHGRNLDFEMWELISRLLVTIDYYKDGKFLYSSDSVVITAFALTGMKPGAFSINVDTRYTRNFEESLISVIKNNAIPVCWLLRKVFEEESTYAGAVQKLRNEKIAAPVYYIIAGLNPNEGMVIQRAINGTHAYYELSDETWFLVQTNYDRDHAEPVYDQRRIPMEKRVREHGPDFTVDTVLKEMFTWPNFNIATIMTAVMVPSKSYHNVTAWYGLNPPEKKQILQLSQE